MAKDPNKLWNHWNFCFQSPEQQQRLQRAISPEYTPISIDCNNCTAKIRGKSSTYTVSLESCSCSDFQRRNLPCKHMYRLAIELGVIDQPVLSYKSGDGYSWKKAVEIIEKYPEEVQRTFYEIFKATKNDMISVKKKKTDALCQLVKDGVLVSQHETPKFYTVRPIEDFFKEKQKVHYYFSRKFRLLDGCEDSLPDDEITHFLYKRNSMQNRVADSVSFDSSSFKLGRDYFVNGNFNNSTVSDDVVPSKPHRVSGAKSIVLCVLLIFIGIILCNVSVFLGLILIIYAIYRTIRHYRSDNSSK